MKPFPVATAAAFAALTLTLTLTPSRLVAADSTHAPGESLRNSYNAERQELLIEALQLDESQRAAFKPMQARYRAQQEMLGDEIIKLVLQYAEDYPDIPEDLARTLLKQYNSLEKKLAGQREKYMKQAGRVLPASKALRLAQLENRLDLVIRLQLASIIPLLPIEGRLTATSSEASIHALGVPGGTFVQTQELQATVAAINTPQRKLTLVSPDGFKQTVKVSPEAVNFDQIRVGDVLQMTLTEQLVVAMAEPGERSDGASLALVALAPKGVKPGGLLAETTRVTGTVTTLDPRKCTVTLRFEDGSSKTLPVRADVDLSQHKAGDQVVFHLTETLAIKVARP
jgi:hypothetical protein